MHNAIVQFFIKKHGAIQDKIFLLKAKFKVKEKGGIVSAPFVFALNILFLKIYQNILEFLIIILVDPAQAFVALKKHEESAITNVSYVEYRTYSKKLKLLSLGGVSSLFIATLMVSFFVSFLERGFKGSAATSTWTQDDWGGTENATLYAVDPTNKTGWTNYSQKDSTVTIVNVGGKNVLTVSDTVNSFKTTDTDFNASGSSFSFTGLNGQSGSASSIVLSVPE